MCAAETSRQRKGSPQAGPHAGPLAACLPSAGLSDSWLTGVIRRLIIGSRLAWVCEPLEPVGQAAGKTADRASAPCPHQPS